MTLIDQQANNQLLQKLRQKDICAQIVQLWIVVLWRKQDNGPIQELQEDRLVIP